MTVKIADLAMLRGDSLSIAIVCKQKTSDGSEVNVDLTLGGVKLWMTAKRRIVDTDANAVFQITSPTDIVIDPDSLSGAATITVPADATKDLRYGEGVTRIELYYDIQVKLGSGYIQTLQKGKLFVDADVTQAVV